MSDNTTLPPIVGFFVDEDGFVRTTEAPGPGRYTVRAWTGTRNLDVERSRPPIKSGEGIYLCDHDDFVVYECTYFTTREEINKVCGQVVPMFTDRYLAPAQRCTLNVTVPKGYRKVIDGKILPGDLVWNDSYKHWDAADAKMLTDDITAYYGVARA